MANAPEIELRNISKSFGSVQANKNVSFTIKENSLHGVVGENGAGKSTIMKVLYGLYPPNSGTIRLGDSEIAFRNPQEAIKMGVGMVHQHFMLVPTLTVWENIVLGKEPSLGKLNLAQILQKLTQLQEQYGFNLDLTKRIEDLPVGHQQQVEILKLLYREANILILDEPTAVLTPQEVEKLFEKMRTLWKQGKTIILITHKLKEILSFTKQVTVMRQGEVIDTVETESLTESSLAEKIVGRKLVSLPERKAEAAPKAVIEMHEVCVPGHENKLALNQLSLTVNSGEIVGIAGIEGNGQHQLVEILAGVNREFTGKVSMNGSDVCEHPTYTAKQTGMGIIPPDRHHEAVILDFSVLENLILGHHKESNYCKKSWISRLKCDKYANHIMEQFDVRPRRTDLPMGALSGGNQQKAVIARELSQGEIKFLLAAHPTRGVDIGAIEFIHQLFLEEREKGAAILLISSELEEILALSDRIVVLYDGKIMGETTPQKTTEAELGLWMTGATA